ncbi:MAG: aminotransferase class I/II-fold pyridoxal phosphate-dependent enzyme [Gammaproteobacteria bacterium]|nr:MAG: aminotransferase class I/II-fold pyridoxal phosphate-dependent enzyme [Gammaproteobacteria bacterium]
MLKRRNKGVGESTTVSSVRRFDRSSNKIPDTFCRFDKHPDYQQIKIQKAAGETLHIDNPFFIPREGVQSNLTSINGHQLINFASYNYLDLCGHPVVSKAAKAAIDEMGTSVSASRPMSGERTLQRELEAELADFYGVEDSVVFVSGHATNVSTIGSLFGPNDLVVHDALIHNSVTQGVQLSGAHRLSFPHNDWKALDDLLEKNRLAYERVLIVVEGLYGMDGDIPDLPRFIEVKNRHKAFLMVDEAHAIGVLGHTGRGIAEHFGVDGPEVDIWMGTLSKTLASCGGYIAGEKTLIELLKVIAPGFLYSVGISPPAAAASLAALKILKAEPERVQRLQHNGSLFLQLAKERGIDTGLSEGYSVVPAITASSISAVKLTNALQARGVSVQPIIYPGVEEGAARLRFFISSAHTDEQIQTAVEYLSEEAKKLKIKTLK